MPAPDFITVAQLARLVGTPDGPRIVDLRSDDERATDARFLPAATRHDHRAVGSWSGRYKDRSVVAVCGRGLEIGQGVGETHNWPVPGRAGAGA